jgi:hypothetical protein
MPAGTSITYLSGVFNAGVAARHFANGQTSRRHVNVKLRQQSWQVALMNVFLLRR